MNKINIIIVEDEPIIAAELEDRLLDMGYQVLGIFDKGEAAFAALDRLKPDLILMDVQLAGVWDGIETTRQIANKSKVPVIYITSNSDDKTFREAKATKPAAFIAKPFRGRDVIHAIELAILQASEKEDKVEQKVVFDEGQSVLTEDRLFIKHRNQLERVFFKDILWIEADGYYCRVFTIKSEIMVTQTLAKFTERLSKRPDFCRVHRSYFVNLSHVERIGDNALWIKGKEIPVSQSSRADLLQRLKPL